MTTTPSASHAHAPEGFRVVLLAKPYRLTTFLESRLLETGCLVGVVHERRIRTAGDLIAFTKQFVRREGVRRALDVLAYQFYQRVVRRPAFKRAADAILPLRTVEVSNGVPRFEVANANTTTAREIIERLRPDLIVVHATGILKPETFRLARCFTVNLHCGALPAYRGHDSTFWALSRGDLDELGVTIHVVEEGVDTGGTLREGRVTCRPEDTDLTIWFKAFALGVDLTMDLVESLRNGTLATRLPRSSERGPHYRRRGLSDHLRFIVRKPRALALAPGAAAAATGQLTVREIRDRETWDRLVLEFPAHDLHQGFDWGELRAADGWGCHRLAVAGSTRCVAAISVHSMALPGLGASVLYAPRGPLMDLGDREAWSGLRSAIELVRARTNAAFLRFSPGFPDTDVTGRGALLAHGLRHLPEVSTVWNVPRIVMMLDLTGDEEHLWRRLRRRHREYIHAAQRKGVSVAAATTIDEVRAFHETLVQSARAAKYPVRGFAHFERLWRVFSASGHGVLIVARHGGRVTGGLLGAALGNKAYLLHASTREPDRDIRLHQGPLLYWELVRWAKTGKCDLLDLGGTGTGFPAQVSDAGFGVYHFKLGLGASLELMTGYYDLVFKPSLYRAFRLAERRLLPLLWDLRARLGP